MALKKSYKEQYLSYLKGGSVKANQSILTQTENEAQNDNNFDTLLQSK